MEEQEWYICLYSHRKEGQNSNNITDMQYFPTIIITRLCNGPYALKLYLMQLVKQNTIYVE
jgi:hypothetical protein